MNDWVPWRRPDRHFGPGSLFRAILPQPRTGVYDAIIIPYAAYMGIWVTAALFRSALRPSAQRNCVLNLSSR
jgi:hypothetical protein